MFEKIKSRKFLLTLAGIAGNILLAIGGQIDAGTAVQNIGGIILAYMAAEGAVDFAGALKKTLSKE